MDMDIDMPQLSLAACNETKENQDCDCEATNHQSMNAKKIESFAIEIDQKDEKNNKQENSFIQSINQIKFLNFLGNGQFGQVYAGLHTPTQKIIAIKRIELFSETHERQIKRELSALINAKTKGVVTFYNVFELDGCVNICMEYCACGSLNDILKAVGKIPEIILSKFTLNILKGLCFLHYTHPYYIHRDIKPANILVDHNGIAKLADFGITRQILPNNNKMSINNNNNNNNNNSFANNNNTIGHCMTHVGTASFMSPERMSGEKYSRRADIWSLGLTLYQCATGIFPYPHKSEFELAIAVCNGPVPNIDNKKYQFSQEFLSFIFQACLQKNPKDRMSTQKLVKHPWIEKGNKENVDMKKWIQQNKLIIDIDQKNVQNSCSFHV